MNQHHFSRIKCANEGAGPFAIVQRVVENLALNARRYGCKFADNPNRNVLLQVKLQEAIGYDLNVVHLRNFGSDPLMSFYNVKQQ